MTDFRLEDSPVAIGTLRTSRILVAAFSQGILVFSAVVAYLVWGTDQGNLQVSQPVIASVAAGTAAVLLILSGIIPGMVVSNQRSRFDSSVKPEELVPLFQTKLITAGALLEGGAFFNLIAFLIEKQWWSFGIALVLLMGIVLKFPTASQIENFVRHQTELTGLERSGNST